MVVSTVTSQHEGPGWIEVCTFSLCVHVFYLVSSNSPNTCIFRAGGDSMINESEKYVSCDRMDTCTGCISCLHSISAWNKHHRHQDIREFLIKKRYLFKCSQ